MTPLGQTVQLTATFANRIYSAPRLLMHGGVIALIGAVVLTGSTGHPARLNPLANQTGFGSVLDQAATADVAAKVAEQTNLMVTREADSTAKTLNSQVSLPTSDDTTLASQSVVDTAGAAGRSITSYAVQPGDTLASIGEQFNITSDTVRWANGIAADGALKPGQKLTILPVSGVQYTVQSGDTAQSIADHFQANADQITAFNNAEVNGIKAGQSIIVPDGVMPDAANPAGAAATPSAPSASTGSADSAGASSAPVKAQPGGPNSYAFGYCTWYVATRRAIPSFWGNANAWYSNAQISGFSVGATPRPGAIAWTGAGYYGHVAYVESVVGGNVIVSEMNWNGNWDRKTFRTAPASSFRYIY